MAISRGSIHHHPREDVVSLITALLNRNKSQRPSPSKRHESAQIIASYFGSQYVHFSPYARTSLYAILKSLRISKGQEILMTPFNIAPMLHIVLSLGLKPRFVDINLHDFGPDFDHLLKELSRRPACFLLTYLFGYVPEIEMIMEACQEHGVPLIEDISQNIGTRYKGQLLGTFGHAAFYSASLTKYVDAYNGSFILTNSTEIHRALGDFTSTLSEPKASRIRAIIGKTLAWNLALSPLIFNGFTYPVLRLLRRCNRNLFDSLLGPSISIDACTNRELPHYYFEDIALIQIESLIRYMMRLEKLLIRRRACANLLLETFQQMTISNPELVPSPLSHQGEDPSYWQFLMRVPDMKIAQDLLFRAGIETGITNLPNLADYQDTPLTNARALKSEFIFLPLHFHLKSKDYRRMLSHLGVVRKH